MIRLLSTRYRHKRHILFARTLYLPRRNQSPRVTKQHHLQKDLWIIRLAACLIIVVSVIKDGGINACLHQSMNRKLQAPRHQLLIQTDRNQNAL